MRRFASLRRAGDFARLRARGRRTSTLNLTIFRGDAVQADTLPLVGISISKTVGGAVVRNRIRRRLAAALQELLTDSELLRLLVIARPSAAEASYASLREQMRRVLA